MKEIEDYKTRQLEQMAQKIILILESEKVSEDIQDVVFAIADHAILNAEDEKSRIEYINKRFARALRSHDDEFIKAVLRQSEQRNGIND